MLRLGQRHLAVITNIGSGQPLQHLDRATIKPDHQAVADAFGADQATAFGVKHQAVADEFVAALDALPQLGGVAAEYTEQVPEMQNLPAEILLFRSGSS